MSKTPTAEQSDPEEHKLGLNIEPSPKPLRLPEDFFEIRRNPVPESFKDCDNCGRNTMLLGHGCQNSKCGTPDYSSI